MPIIELIVILMIVGVVVYVLNNVLPMDARIKLIVNAIIIIAVLLWLLDVVFGLDMGHVGHHRLT